ncbi:unnamed protein product [Mytilus coruscus]|uniref:Uncharacterized protein n=1 Tax=Mytilus coruscus TaxID=42192 RepID=A0A6J8DQ72_MYTCO|nr:unnamed protein product [Mytilus coruscus]
MIKNVGKIMNSALKIVESSGNGYEAMQSNFLRDYTSCSPQVTTDDLAKLVSTKRTNKTGDYSWLDLSMLFRGKTVPFQVAETDWWMQHAKLLPSQRGHSFYLAGFQIYMPIVSDDDRPFDLMETMANLMRSLTQIQSSKILGEGPKTQHPSGLSVDTIKTLVAVSSMSYNILQTTNVQMLCNILEYKQGRKPQLCNELATDIDRLLASRDSECHAELKFITVSTKRTNKTGDYSWLDLSMLFRGKTVPFQVAETDWWMQHAKLLPSQRGHSF